MSFKRATTNDFLSFEWKIHPKHRKLFLLLLCHYARFLVFVVFVVFIFFFFFFSIIVHHRFGQIVVFFASIARDWLRVELELRSWNFAFSIRIVNNCTTWFKLALRWNDNRVCFSFTIIFSIFYHELLKPLIKIKIKICCILSCLKLS